MSAAMSKEHDEKVLTECARRGDGEALGKLFRLFREPLQATISARTGEALAAAVEPEDILQDTYVRL